MLKKSIKNIKDWFIRTIDKKSAEYWVIFLAIVETSVFFIPSDALVIPMTLRNPSKAWRYATISLIASIIGAIIGWFLGYYSFEVIVKPILEFYGKFDSFLYFKDTLPFSLLLLFIFTSGLMHLPPMKVMTLLAGVIHLNLFLFIILSIVSRGLRSYITAWIILKYGEKMLNFILTRLKLLTYVTFIAMIIALLYFNFIK
ncbi:YqaA family protein [Bartonella sp. DGB1]|uniref:YqaA family protein n=1 Tax=Bartonella sp. DGB1 TaxID=3239807 RepID=UPI003524CBC7